MIPIPQYPEPEYFDRNIRQKGRQWLQKKGISPNDIVEEGFEFHDYWTRCKNDLEKLYENYCAYTCFHMHPTEYSTIDHIKPKSCVEAYLAYEWTNYCLCCEVINTKKGNKLDIINPYKVTTDLFFLILESGYIFANDSHPDFSSAKQTIDGLDLNNGRWMKYRQKAFLSFVQDRKAGLSLQRAEQNLKDKNILVWSEAKRQGRLQ